MSNGPYYYNTLSSLEIDGERVDLRWVALTASTDDPPPLQEIGAQRLR